MIRQPKIKLYALQPIASPKLFTTRNLSFNANSGVNDTRIQTDVHAQQAPNSTNSRIFSPAFTYTYTNTNAFPVQLDLTIIAGISSNSSGAGGVNNPFAANDETIVYWNYNNTAVSSTVLVESGILASAGLISTTNSFYTKFPGSGPNALTHNETETCTLHRLIAPGGSITITPNFWLVSTFLNGLAIGAALRTWRTGITFIEKIINY